MRTKKSFFSHYINSKAPRAGTLGAEPQQGKGNTQMNQPQLGNFESIALAAIRPSPTNPRKHFDQLQLEELARSIGEMGVTNPLILRPWPTERIRGPYDIGPAIDHVHFEIVAGERRYRAAIMANLMGVPAIVRDLTDDEVLNVQIVENLQRADLHPMEEAEGYRVLLEGGASSEEIAKRTGKAVPYVLQRIRLLSLAPIGRDLFLEGHLTLGHALTLAKLEAHGQEQAFRYLLRAEGDYKKMSTADVLEARRKNIATNRWAKNSRLVDATEGELRDWIKENLLLQLKGVPWDINDANLLPEVGSCVACSKRSGNNQALFSDLTTEESTCLDAVCFGNKQKAIQVVTIQAAADAGEKLPRLSAKSGHKLIDANKKNPILRHGQWVKALEGSCPSVTKAILTDAPGNYSNLKEHQPGEVLSVCANQKCKIHKHVVERKQEARKDERKESDEQVKLRQEAKSLKDQAFTDGRVAGFSKILAKMSPGQFAREVLEYFIEDSWNTDYGLLCDVLDIPFGGGTDAAERADAHRSFDRWKDGAPFDELLKASFTLFNIEAVNSGSDLVRIGKKYKVNVDAELKAADARVARIESEYQEKIKALAKPATSANKATKKVVKKASATRKIDGKSAAAGATKEATA